MPACLPMKFGEDGFASSLMFASVSGTHTFVYSGNDCVSHIIIPSQNAGWSWKSQKAPGLDCVGSAAGSLGRVSW